MICSCAHACMCITHPQHLTENEEWGKGRQSLYPLYNLWLCFQIIFCRIITLIYKNGKLQVHFSMNDSKIHFCNHNLRKNGIWNSAFHIRSHHLYMQCIICSAEDIIFFYLTLSISLFSVVLFLLVNQITVLFFSISHVNVGYLLFIAILLMVTYFCTHHHQMHIY